MVEGRITSQHRKRTKNDISTPFSLKHHHHNQQHSSSSSSLTFSSSSSLSSSSSDAALRQRPTRRRHLFLICFCSILSIFLCVYFSFFYHHHQQIDDDLQWKPKNRKGEGGGEENMLTLEKRNVGIKKNTASSSSFSSSFSSSSTIRFYSFDLNETKIIPHRHQPMDEERMNEQEQEGNKFYESSSYTEKEEMAKVDIKKKKININFEPFTQGLFFTQNSEVIVESAGLYGGSLLRLVNVTTGETIHFVRLDDKYFGEGACQIWGGKITLQLTWKEKKMLVYDTQSLRLMQTLNIDLREGWGLAAEYDLFDEKENDRKSNHDQNYKNNKEKKKEERENAIIHPSFIEEEELHQKEKRKNKRVEEKSRKRRRKQKLWATTGDAYLLELELWDSSEGGGDEEEEEEEEGEVKVEEDEERKRDNNGGNSSSHSSSDSNSSSGNSSFSSSHFVFSEVRVKRRILLRCLGSEIQFVNELEFHPLRRTLWGNVFGTFLIFEFDPISGECRSIVSLGGLYNPARNSLKIHSSLVNDVMNGIAWHNNFGNDVFLVTGKRWPKMYFVRLRELKRRRKGENNRKIHRNEEEREEEDEEEERDKIILKSLKEVNEEWPGFFSAEGIDEYQKEFV